MTQAQPDDIMRCALVNCRLRVNGRDWIIVQRADGSGEGREGFCSAAHARLVHQFLGDLPHELVLGSEDELAKRRRMRQQRMSGESE